LEIEAKGWCIFFEQQPDNDTCFLKLGADILTGA
jgi:hypothetical protein